MRHIHIYVLSVLFSLISLVSGRLSAQDNIKEQKLKTEIQSIIVYLDGAEIHHNATVKLNAGKHRLIFEGLSPKIDPKSIQVMPNGKLNILAISNHTDYMSASDDSPRIKELKDSTELLNGRIKEVRDDNEAYSIEKNMLLKNQVFGSNEKNLTVAELEGAANFYRNRMKDINKKLTKCEENINELNKVLRKTQMELNELNAQYSTPRGKISVLVSTEQPITASIDLKYLVYDAGWAPAYDLRATDVTLPISLIYRAKVFNNTLVDWNEVNLKLSTANPQQSASQPTLSPWYLDYGYNYNRSSSYNWYSSQQNQQGVKGNQDINIEQSIIGGNEGYMQNMAVSADFETLDITNGVNLEVNPLYLDIEISQASAEFDISQKYSIPSNNKPYLVDVIEYKLPATFKHFAVTKIDRDAFLMARITGWEDLNLVEGPANVYLADTYVGQSYINTRNVSDTLDLSFGRDKKVLITRSKLKDYSSKKFMGSKIKETHAYEMVVKNNTKGTVELELLDQIPVSNNSEIEVETEEISGAQIDVLSGKLTWKLRLEPGATQKLKLTFSVKYPKNKEVNVKGETYKAAKMRMF